MDITIQITKDDLLKVIEENKDEFSCIEKKKIIEMLCNNSRGCTDDSRLLANVADIIYHS